MSSNLIAGSRILQLASKALTNLMLKRPLNRCRRKNLTVRSRT